VCVKTRLMREKKINKKIKGLIAAINTIKNCSFDRPSKMNFTL